MRIEDVKNGEDIFYVTEPDFDCLSIIYPKIRNKETDDVYRKVFNNSSSYDYFIDGIKKPMIYISECDWFSTMCDWDVSDAKTLKTKLYWFQTKTEVRYAHNLFAKYRNDLIINQAKKIIDIKQFILAMLWSGYCHDLISDDYSYDSLLHSYNKICADSFYFCGFTKREWNEYIKDKPKDVDYFIKVFNNLVYKLYKNIQNSIKDKHDKIFISRDFRLSNIITESNIKNGCAPTFMPLSYDWLDCIVRLCDTIT